MRMAVFVTEALNSHQLSCGGHLQELKQFLRKIKTLERVLSAQHAAFVKLGMSDVSCKGSIKDKSGIRLATGFSLRKKLYEEVKCSVLGILCHLPS